MTLDELLDDLFHGCAFAAFVEEARAAQGSPDPEPTRQRAYAIYEAELAARSRGAPPMTACSVGIQATPMSLSEAL